MRRNGLNGGVPSSDGFFPLQVKNNSNKVLHAVCAVLLHGLCEVRVTIQSECGGGVAQVSLHGLDVIPGPDCVNGVCMPLWHNKDKSENPYGARS